MLALFWSSGASTLILTLIIQTKQSHQGQCNSVCTQSFPVNVLRVILRILRNEPFSDYVCPRESVSTPTDLGAISCDPQSVLAQSTLANSTMWKKEPYCSTSVLLSQLGSQKGIYITVLYF